MTITRTPDAEVRSLTREDMIREREALLESVGMDEDVLRERGEAYELDARDRGVLAEIDGLDFLLDHTRVEPTPS